MDHLIIIDGYNVIHRTPQLKPGGDRALRESRETLVNPLSWMIGLGYPETELWPFCRAGFV